MLPAKSSDIIIPNSLSMISDYEDEFNRLHTAVFHHGRCGCEILMADIKSFRNSLLRDIQCISSCHPDDIGLLRIFYKEAGEFEQYVRRVPANNH